jgi:hypothetical protein
VSGLDMPLSNQVDSSVTRTEEIICVAGLEQLGSKNNRVMVRKNSTALWQCGSHVPLILISQSVSFAW